MKNWKLILAILLIVVFAAFGIASSSKETDDQGAASASQTESDANLGKYSVTIDSCRLAKDYEGKPVVIIKYNFTNVSDDNSAAFYIAFDDTVYQNGVGLNEAYILQDGANYNGDDQMKEIKKGASLAVERAYELNDTTTDVEVEVKELFSLDDQVIKKSFVIAQ